MSNDIDNRESEEFESESIAYSRSEQRKGVRDGESWARNHASWNELRNVFERGEQRRIPRLQGCNVHEAIRQVVRITLPPCELDVDTALDYWSRMTKRRGNMVYTLPYVTGFLKSACETVLEMVSESARNVAEYWLQNKDNAICEILRLEQFVEDEYDSLTEHYGFLEPSDSWFDTCFDNFEVALTMGGYNISLFRAPDDCTLKASPNVLFAFRQMVQEPSFAGDTEEFAGHFVEAVLSLVCKGKHREASPAKDLSADGGSDGTDPDADQETVVEEPTPTVRNPQLVTTSDSHRDRAECARSGDAHPETGSAPSTPLREEGSDN